MKSVLFVCAANICRSPMAMGLLHYKIRNMLQWRVESAGVWAQLGNPPAEYTQLVLKEAGIDLSDYRSRPITRELIDKFNLILTMEIGQKEALKAAFPDQASKIYLISEMIGQVNDIIDPIGGSLVDFQDTAKEINRIISRGFTKISALAGGEESQDA